MLGFNTGRLWHHTIGQRIADHYNTCRKRHLNDHWQLPTHLGFADRQVFGIVKRSLDRPIACHLRRNGKITPSSRLTMAKLTGLPYAHHQARLSG